VSVLYDSHIIVRDGVRDDWQEVDHTFNPIERYFGMEDKVDHVIGIDSLTGEIVTLRINKENRTTVLRTKTEHED